MKIKSLIFLLAWAFTVASVAAAEVSGKVIAFACSTCHSPDSQLVKQGMPLFKSQTASHLEKVLLDYKYGRKSATIMDRICKGYTDSELKAVAEYFIPFTRNN